MGKKSRHCFGTGFKDHPENCLCWICQRNNEGYYTPEKRKEREEDANGK